MSRLILPGGPVWAKMRAAGRSCRPGWFVRLALVVVLVAVVLILVLVVVLVLVAVILILVVVLVPVLIVVLVVLIIHRAKPPFQVVRPYCCQPVDTLFAVEGNKRQNTENTTDI